MELDVHNKEAILLSDYPDFSQLGYQVIQELGRNQKEGRITYLANIQNSNYKVVIKEFSFAHTSVDWSGLKPYEREMEILRRLDHPRIPRYVDSFATPKSFYLVQEYKNAPSLGLQRNFNLEQIKQISLSILEILVYLQQLDEPIIHRDIKPENILVDDQLNAYLVDFDLAQIQSAKITVSTLAAGTPGFIPPEEQLGYSLTQASDLYSLGVTLICLLTNTRAVDIAKLIDDRDRFNFQKLLPRLNPRFKSWLMKMVEPKPKYRYANAAVALEDIKSIEVSDTATAIETLIAAVKFRKQTTMLGLAMMAMFAVATTTLILSQQGGVAQQLQQSSQCQGCDF
ncbi:serine/threonine protein kinase [Nostoc sp. CENA67]|uniref:non-specific serine/threonine protein kinase n=1 Tax=Amazonocrinis nigriterrae CENA67 TaxID=2794033 RepID=A0A8J7L9P4_9NOST|nr:serine/threonine-protein kinase [Amazonocrinis nigriterrae]MBH8563191.1 serine/threonine protein kinase [Amazonocrinis nigriterrae CENA67]